MQRITADLRSDKSHSRVAFVSAVSDERPPQPTTFSCQDSCSDVETANILFIEYATAGQHKNTQITTEKQKDHHTE